MSHINQTVDESGRESIPSVPAEIIPSQIGRYRIEKVLGKGGFGLVYLAHDDQLQRLVAIKVPHRKLVDRPEAAEAYLTEARTVANLDHPNIVPVYDVGSTDDCPFYAVSKFIDGTDLATKLKQSLLSIQETVELLTTVAEALHHAHKQGLVHRDIKPGNILLDKSGKPFVADFGLALREQDVGKGPRYAGTPAYMSPEQARGEGHRVDGRSDIFSLGVVFYQLLTGRRPFQADSREELLEQITSREVRPPRQWDDTIPKELERICLKALSKRATERYTTAKDLGDDLRHFLAVASAEEKSSFTAQVKQEAEVATPLPSPVPTPSDQQAFKIVPKGLRSFDANDADFFLELVPGPRDRDGLPDSIRFWKTRIEEVNADNTFAVGLLYGPSGCGKSSLVKAGLLPRLAQAVLAVYIEATGAETEARLLKGLRRQLADLPSNLDLIEALAALRQGRFLESGQKVLVVLDQFEQWLHARPTEENTELVQALRQCDGGRVQCLVMVRDDFWLAVSRFMKAIEVEIVEGRNSALVDLFDPIHARKVLAAFGRAYGRLPENLGQSTKQQNAFLDQAVAGLAQDGKVISVRLALFAEMMKGKPWTPATLKEVGGTAGVGVTFLEETFTASTAPPPHRLHQKAAQAVLRALLPESGTDIKGNMRSHQELLLASGYESRTRDFDELLRILDGELRLITPTDPEGVDSENASSTQVVAWQKYYQLTHDYLVPSLRDWLTRKQKETRRGRAELLLADRAAVWNARPENRQPPSLRQWLSIRWLTQKQKWTPPQRKMMQQAGRYHAMRAAGLALVLAVATITGLAIRAQVEEQQQAIRTQAEEERQATHAAGLVQALLKADTAQVPALIGKMAEYRSWVDPLLRVENARAVANSRPQLHIRLALLPVDATQVDSLYGRLLEATPEEVAVLRDALVPHQDALRDKLWGAILELAKDKQGQRLCAAAALAMYDPASLRWARVQEAVAQDLVKVETFYLKAWMEVLRPVRVPLLAPLSVVYADGQRDPVERKLATDILSDYASDQPRVLANLVMDSDLQKFGLFFAKLQAHGVQGLPVLIGEIDKRVVIAKDKMIFEQKGTIDDKDPKVKPLQGPAMPTKRFEVRLEGGKTYRFTMDSKELDSFLVLQDKTGKELASDDDSGGGLNSLLVYTPASAGAYTVFAAAVPNPMVKSTGSFVLKVMETGNAEEAKEKLAKRQANAAVALLKMKQPERVWPLLKHSRDPRVRSYVIDRLYPQGVDARTMIERLQEEPDITIQRALLLSLGEYGEKDMAPTDRQAVVAKAKGIYRSEADAGLHASSEWLLRQWQEEGWLKQRNDAWAKDGEGRKKRIAVIEELLRKEKEKMSPPQWYVNSQGQTLVVIAGPVEFTIGSPPTEADRFGGPSGQAERQVKKVIKRHVAIASKEVTVGQFLAFRKNHNYSKEYARTQDCPVINVSWHDAAAYCNWLSDREGLERCYEAKAGPEGMKAKANYLQLSGYRLPTEAEWEYGCRAEGETSRYYGESAALLGKYAWYEKNSQSRWLLPVGRLKPNDFGLFDMLGNAFEWCQDGPFIYVGGEDKEDVRDVNSRVLRGGSFNNQASDMRSANRNINAPTNRVDYNGFRLARTLRLVPFIALPPPPFGGRY